MLTTQELTELIGQRLTEEDELDVEIREGEIVVRVYGGGAAGCTRDPDRVFHILVNRTGGAK